MFAVTLIEAPEALPDYARVLVRNDVEGRAMQFYTNVRAERNMHELAATGKYMDTFRLSDAEGKAIAEMTRSWANSRYNPVGILVGVEYVPRVLDGDQPSSREKAMPPAIPQIATPPVPATPPVSAASSTPAPLGALTPPAATARPAASSDATVPLLVTGGLLALGTFVWALIEAGRPARTIDELIAEERIRQAMSRKM